MTALRLSYGELAERLGVSGEAARAVARRRGWQRVKGNDGRTVVLVEEAQLVRRPGARPPVHPDGRPDDVTGPVTGDQLWQRIAALEAATERLTAELLAASVRAARAEGAEQALRSALADLATRLDHATAELAHARRPWWARLPRRKGT